MTRVIWKKKKKTALLCDAEKKENQRGIDMEVVASAGKDSGWSSVPTASPE